MSFLRRLIWLFVSLLQGWLSSSTRPRRRTIRVPAGIPAEKTAVSQVPNPEKAERRNAQIAPRQEQQEAAPPQSVTGESSPVAFRSDVQELSQPLTPEGEAQGRRQSKAAQRQTKLRMREAEQLKKVRDLGIRLPTPQVPMQTSRNGPRRLRQRKPGQSLDELRQRWAEWAQEVGTSAEKENFLCLELHGYSVRQALRRFFEEFNGHVEEGVNQGFSLRVCHGYSTSDNPRALTIKNLLRAICECYSETMVYCPGGEFGDNPGETVVVPLSCLPPFSQTLFSLLERTISGNA